MRFILFRSIVAFGSLLFAGLLTSMAAVYYVSPDGDDSNDGRSADTAFRTIQRGMDGLQAGDALEIFPGEYFEAIERADLGSADVDTVIRAVIPGTVLLRGDVPVSGFVKVDGYRWVYAVDFDELVHSVVERDTLSVFKRMRSPAELDINPGSFYYDEQGQRLYIATSDMLPPSVHDYGAVLFGSHGMHLIRPQRVIIEGIAVSGFSAGVERERTGLGYGVKWGIFLDNPDQCVIRDCHSFLNGAGISYHRTADGRNNLIERCVAFANVGAYDAGGGIQGFSSDHDEIRDCLVYRTGDVGIGFYGMGIRGPSILRNNLAWGNGTADIRIKGGGGLHGLAENCVTMANLDVKDVRYSIIGDDNIYNRDPGSDVIFYHEAERQRADHDFADPLNMDFRLQADSQYRGSGPDGTDRGAFQYQATIFYLDPSGSDSADGLSVRSAWRTLDHALARLRPGDTLYLLAGEYTATAPLVVKGGDGARVVLSGRGADEVIIRGLFTVDGSSAVELERLVFKGEVDVRGATGITFDNCQFLGRGTGLQVRDSRELRLTHGLFAGFEASALKLCNVADVYLSGLIFDNTGGVAVDKDVASTIVYSDYNSYVRRVDSWLDGGQASAAPGPHSVERQPRLSVSSSGRLVVANPLAFAGVGPLGRPIGVARITESIPMHVSEPVVHAVSDSTVDIEWWMSAPAECLVRWGKVGGEMVEDVVIADGYATFSLDTLAAGEDYVFELVRVSPRGLAALQLVEGVEAGFSLNFTTAAAAAEPVTYFVSPDGDDANSGLSREGAFRSITRAAAMATPGDTVEVMAGSYSELVRIRATGTEGRPITFRAAAGERVILDGDRRSMTTAFSLSRKNHIIIDGFYFQGFGVLGWDGAIHVIQSDDVTIRRCFISGRGRGTSPRFVYAEYAANLTIENCAIISGYEGVVVRGCPNLVIRNNVFLRNLIQAVIINNNPEQKVTIENNVFTDSHTGKARSFFVELARVESLVENNNVFYMRLPDEERRIFAFYGNEQYERAMVGYGIPVIYPQEPLITELTRMSLADYQKQFAPHSTSVFADPVFARVLEMDAAERDQYQGDRVANLATDFADLFVTNPELVGRGVGLQPEAFSSVR